MQLEYSLKEPINGRRISTNGSIAFPKIRFCMRKRSNARAGIPTGGNAEEDEDSRRYQHSAPRNSAREPAVRRCEERTENHAPAAPPALRYASERAGVLECLHSPHRL